ncbi:cytochrome c oxidase subunit 4 isoform 1, mitochondrial-like [Brevipalpus obovatus]|uniref:cytochrome c oxidase subunit 4 isoform 1, mitochondrial-like n=1 Tax=Brevipalpus obovatus TaxID=246614 RepID=UPI003D9E2002
MSYNGFRSLMSKEFSLIVINRVNCLQQSRGIHGIQVTRKWRDIVGNREVVGFGINGDPTYYDRPIRPFPAIRFRQDTPEMLKLKEKEKGDWKNLTKDEKKTLYRHSFCRTYAELLAPSGVWKLYLAGCLWCVSMGMTLFLLNKVYNMPPLPESFLPDNMRLALKFHLVNHTDEVEGISSKWDYENNCWKKK